MSFDTFKIAHERESEIVYDKQDNQARDIKLCHTLRVKSFLNPSACKLDK